MKVLFIGGTGLISQAVTELLVSKDYDLTVLNRGNNNDVLPEGVRHIKADIYNEDQMQEVLKKQNFDCVVEWIAFTKEHVERDVRLFKGKTKQYIFISSASAYHKPALDYPITEETPLSNPYWEYSRNKQYCEEYLFDIATEDFNVTIIRPSHTYNDTKLMIAIKTWGGEFGHIKRLQEGKPVIIPGDGTSLWTITHNTDFAFAFEAVIGNEEAYGQAYHITSDKVYTWERLNELMAKALGVKPNVIHIPTDFILQYFPDMEGELLGDKTWSTIFDNSKIKALAPDFKAKVGYEDVVDKAIKYYLNTKEKQVVNEEFEKIYDEIILDYTRQKR
jgi:nucleoside-diphosphate-sugar epimerase